MTAIRMTIGAKPDPNPNNPPGSQIPISSPGLTNTGNIYGSTNAAPFKEYMVAAQAIPAYRGGYVIWKMSPATIVGFQTTGTTPSIEAAPQQWLAYVW